MDHRRPLLLLLVATLAGACGDPLVGERFLGTPCFEVGGVVDRADSAEGVALPRNLRLSLFWIGFDSRSEERELIEQWTTMDSGLAAFGLTLFDDPPPRALTFDRLVSGGDEGEPQASVGLALVVLYADNNGNGALNSNEPVEDTGPDAVVGASATHLVAYTAAPLPAGSPAAELLGPLSRGYHLFESSGEPCPFRGAQHCAASGALTRVDPAEATIPLTLHADPLSVMVPSPELSSSGNLYAGGL